MFVPIDVWHKGVGDFLYNEHSFWIYLGNEGKIDMASGTIIPSEKEAITHAVKNAKKGSMIIMCSDVVPDALELVKRFKEEEANRLYEFSTEEIPNL